jgi:hypothetical protein
MIANPTPTRAEASDVANAILDGTDAVMLSGETATGHYPVRAVEMMTKISATVEEKMLRWVDPVSFTDVEHTHPITDAISDATATIAKELGARLIVTSTWSGYTARQVARERPREPIMAFTPNEATYRRLALTWGVRSGSQGNSSLSPVGSLWVPDGPISSRCTGYNCRSRPSLNQLALQAVARCGLARPEAEQKLSPQRALGGCSKFQIGYYTPQARREGEQD